MASSDSSDSLIIVFNNESDSIYKGYDSINQYT